MASIEKTYQDVQDGRKITVRINRRRGRYYNDYTFSAAGNEPFSGKAPKGWSCERVLHYWWSGDCVDVETGRPTR